MTFWAECFDGTRFLLGRAIAASLTAEKGVPADLLKAKFPSLGDWPELLRVSAYKNSEMIFNGVVDEQNTSRGSDGIFTEIICRSLSALLIDNEAEPMTLRNPSWRVMCKKYAKPFGINYDENEIIAETATGEFTVKKGESCYSALSRFANIFMGKEISVSNDGVAHILGNECKEIGLNKISNLIKKNLPYKKISQVFVQNSTGAYQIGCVNNESNGICRQRYFMSTDVRSPVQFIRNQNQNAVVWQAVCESFICARPMDYCNINVSGFEPMKDLEISKVQNKLDKSGWKTIINMTSKGAD